MKTLGKTISRSLLVGLVAVTASTTVNAAFSWRWANNNGSSGVRDQIRNSMNSARNSYNANARSVMNYQAPVRYVSSVPTANASYRGTVTFGGSRNARVATHEVAHVYGIGTYSAWRGRLRSNNRWYGHRANNRHQFEYNQGRKVNADRQHFWNFGLNSRWENVPRHCWMVRAFRGDMGLSS